MGIIHRILPLLLATLPAFPMTGQTVGLISQTSDAQDGYVLFSPLSSNTSYLIDNCGRQVHEWEGSYPPGMAGYLLDDGSLLRAGKTPEHFFMDNRGGGGVIERISPDGGILWSYTLSDEQQLQHHGMKPLPNGNFLAIVWEKKTFEEAVEAGRDPSITVPAGIWSEKIVEIQPDASAEGGTVVWEWNVWDHLVQDFDASKPNYGVVSDNPHKINLNYEKVSFDVDWLHINSVDYHPELNQIVLSVHDFDEIWMIDRNTTTEQAAGEAGDLIYRWGNPMTYDRGVEDDKRFFGQHDAQWIPEGYPNAGKLLVYNNGNGRPGPDFSTVDILIPPLDADGGYVLEEGQPYGPAFLDWDYQAPDPQDFFSLIISGAQAQPNGNVLVCEGTPGRFFEVDFLGNKVWEYVSPVSVFGPVSQGSTNINNSVFTCRRIFPDDPGLSALDLTAGDPIELNPLDYECFTSPTTEAIDNQGFDIYPNPAAGTVRLVAPVPIEDLFIFSADGCLQPPPALSPTGLMDVSKYPPGLYFIQIKTERGSSVERLVIMDD